MDVKSLKEPISSRTLSKKEQIILLKASRINGFVFPPWKEPPVPSEFHLEYQAEPFLDVVELKFSSHQMEHFQSWARAKDALPPPSWFPGDRKDLVPTMRASRSVDLVQDAATDCSVVASLCAGIARTERGHDSVFYQTIWPHDQPSKRPTISPNGKYVVRLNFNGCWRKVIIDDRLPLSKTNRTLHVVDRKNCGLLWPALLEKAYLKVRGGYDFPGSNSCSDLWALTGWIPEQIYLQEGDLVPSQLWTRLYAAFLYGDVLVTLGTGKMTHRAERELGLEGQHSYVILDMKETDEEKALLVKNPWLDGKGWRGRRPSLDFLMEDSSLNRTYPRSKEATKSNAKHNPYPSTFWIGLDSVVQHFESLYLNWNTGLFSHRQDIHFSWDLLERSTASGSVADHPQFSFTSDVGGVVWLVLSRHFRDTPVDAHNQSDAFNDGTVRSGRDKATDDDPLKGYMNIYIYDRQGLRVFVKDNYFERGQYVNTPQSLLRWQCQPNSTYTLVIDQEDLLPSLYTFTLSAFSSSTMTLEQARKKYPLEKRISGRWTSETAGGNTHSTKYFDNPQYSLTIGHHTPLAILIQTRDGRHPVHVKLVHGHGKRIHSIQSRNILADSGEHCNGCALAEVHDVPPGTYTIICSMFEADQTEEFSLTVYSGSKCVIQPIPRDGAGMVPTRLTDACFNSLVNKVAAPLVPRRIAAITVIVKFIYARTPNTTLALGKDVKNRNPLRVLIETGRGPQKVLLASSDNGEFSDAGTIRIQRVDLRPEMLYDGDIWLVLERLTSPGSAIEEGFTVELLADAPQAFSAGLWRIWDD
ncbi:cysteine proteinase [Mytilinidion resinicola]|uniref:Cysteine proteinase n=1 Tax=Mytilinidion resinicola TaxID=574789 RepID=A0A6A6Z389_9PEZI|nr:cysteine proteinase [Mytilinidion resinicola]KAF2814625.1 cysteine proteinase [Mytilinidion resinicola]